MAAPLPVNPLPFADDAELQTFTMPITGEQFGPSTKKQFFDELMKTLYPLRNQMKALVEQEKEVRAQVVKLIYPDDFDSRGTDKFELGGGWVLELKRTMNIKIDEQQLPMIREEVAALEVDPETGEVPTIDGIIKFKAELSETNWDATRDDVRELLRPALTFTPGSPGFDIKPPKQTATRRPSDQKARAKDES